jgi:predicted transcriptional regulator of viral defense system
MQCRPPSSSGLGHHPFKVAARVRIPLGVLRKITPKPFIYKGFGVTASSHTPPDSLSWGMRSEWRDNIRLRFADPARTVVDLLDMPKLGGGIRNVADIVRVYLEEGDPLLLVDYGDRLGNRAIFKRLGYLVEFFSPSHVQLVDACRARVSKGISALDPDGPSGGRRAMRWTLRINVNLTDEGPS